MYLSEDAKRAMVVFNVVMNSARHISDDDFCDHEERQKTSDGRKLAESVSLLLVHPPYDVRRQS